MQNTQITLATHPNLFRAHSAMLIAVAGDDLDLDLFELPELVGREAEEFETLLATFSRAELLRLSGGIAVGRSFSEARAALYSVLHCWIQTQTH